MADKQKDIDQNTDTGKPGRRIGGYDALPLDRSALDVETVPLQPLAGAGRRLYSENQTEQTYTPKPEDIEQPD